MGIYMKKLIEKGDKVFIKHQRELGKCTVVNPHEPTDIELPVAQLADGTVVHKAVEYYVRVDTPKAKNQGYHACNLELTK